MESDEPPSPPPKQAPALPPKEPPRVPPKDKKVQRPKRYRDHAPYRGASPTPIELEAEDHNSEADEEQPLIQNDNKAPPSSSRTRSWIFAIAFTFILTLAVILLWGRHSAGQDEGNAGPFQLRPSPPPAKDYSLNFTEQYPPLKSDASDACKTAWAKRDAVPCHSHIWSRNWDRARLNPLGPDLSRYLPQICTEDCTRVLDEMRTDVGGNCWSAEWDIRGYNGRFNTTLLEPNPAKVVETLRRRQEHNCFKSPSDDAEGGYCMTDLEQKWWIWDGMNANHMQNLGNFVRFTNERKIEPGRQISGVRGGMDWKQPYSYWREERKFGPGKEETSCNFCTANWFVRMLQDWDDSTVDENRNAIDLPHYLAKVHKAGRRCDQSGGASFEQMFHMQVTSGYDTLLGDENWFWDITDSQSDQAPGEGPTFLHEPLPAIRAAIMKLDTMHNPLDKTPEEYGEFLHAFHEAALDLTCNALITFKDLERLLSETEDISALCSSSCQSSRLSIRHVFGAYKKHDLRKFDRFARTHNLVNPLVFERSDEILGRACRTEETRYHHMQPCSVVWNKYGKLHWLNLRTIPQVSELVDTVSAAVADLPAVPENLTAVIPKREEDLTNDERQELAAWTRPLRNGACSLCFWRQFVEGRSWASDTLQTKVPGVDVDVAVKPELLAEWMLSMQTMYESCAEVGVQFSEEELLVTKEKVVGKIGARGSRRGT